MSFKFASQRTWLNLKRHKLTIIVTIVTFSFMMMVFGSIYPGTKAIEAYAGIGVVQLITGIVDIGDNPGMFIWILIMSSVFTIIVPVVGIFLGVRLLPFNERDGKELIFSTNKSPLRYFIENFVIVMILIPLILLPPFLISVGFLSLTSEFVTGLAIAFFLPVFFIMVVAMITVLGASIKSSSRIGYAFGGIFFIISFTLNLLSSELEFVKDFNLMSQINVFPHAIAGTWNDSSLSLLFLGNLVVFQYNQYIITCLVIIAILFVLTTYFLYRSDYIESRTSYGKEFKVIKIKRDGSRSITTGVSFVRAPVENILSKIGWKNPAFRDQLQSSAGLFFIYGLITSMMIILVLLTYPGDMLMTILFTDMSAIIDNPLIAAFMFGHTPTATLEGFFILKLMTLHWMYYGPFVFIATYNIIMRDKNGGYDEITWSMPRKRSTVIFQRTLAMLVYLWIIVIANWLSFWGFEILLGVFAGVVVSDFLSTILAFGFLGLGYSLFLIVFIALALIPNPKYLVMTLVGAFMIAIFLPVIAYINPDLSWIAYLSPFQYFDVAGLLLNDVNLISEAIPTIIIGGIISILLYLGSVVLLTPRKDIV